jgi:hypothetical protein
MSEAGVRAIDHGEPDWRAAIHLNPGGLFVAARPQMIS